MRTHFWLALCVGIAACTGKAGTDDTSGGRGTVADGTDGTTDGTGAADGTRGTQTLNGTPPSEPIPAPTFAATNRDGSARSRDDLLGHPTVMWFYPLAASAG